MIRVVLADDQALVRAGFGRCSTPSPTSRWSARRATATMRCALAGQLHPDVVLMDIRMPGVDALAATRQIASDPVLQGVRIIRSPRASPAASSPSGCRA